MTKQREEKVEQGKNRDGRRDKEAGRTLIGAWQGGLISVFGSVLGAGSAA